MRNKLFTNKTIHCFTSIFEKPDEYNQIINLVNKYPKLFKETRGSYTFELPIQVDSSPKYENYKLDFKYLETEFFYGIYEPDAKRKNVMHQIKRAAFEKIYDNFLILSNIINHNKTRENIHFSGYNQLIYHAWVLCSERIFILIRSILNDSKVQDDDISIWKLKAFSIKNDTRSLVGELQILLNFVIKKFKFKSVLKKYINKTLAHLTNWNYKDNIELKDQTLITLQSAFNLFECLYIILKVLYWHTADTATIYDLVMDAPNNDGDLLQQTLIAEASNAYYEQKEANIYSIEACSIARQFCSKNNIPIDFRYIPENIKNNVKQCLANSMVKLDSKSSRAEYYGYADALYRIDKKQN